MDKSIEKKLDKMEKDINKKIETSEYRVSKLKGVSNLTRSDLEMCLMRINHMRRGYYRFMQALGNVKKLFEAYGIDPEYNNATVNW